MEMLNFEKKLNEMEKPQISQLKHEDMLSDAIINAKDKSVVSWWWLSVPVFIILMLLIKSIFMPGTSLISNMHELKTEQKLISVIFFLISPLILILVNALTIKKIHFLSGSPKSISFFEAVWFNIIIIVISVCILIIYSL
jgi:Na+/melibiose symporter-like transporter